MQIEPQPTPEEITAADALIKQVFSIESSLPSEDVWRRLDQARVDAAFQQYLAELASIPPQEVEQRFNGSINASIERGLAQAAAGEVHDLGSFAQYADLEDEDS